MEDMRGEGGLFVAGVPGDTVCALREAAALQMHRACTRHAAARSLITHGERESLHKVHVFSRGASGVGGGWLVGQAGAA